MNCIVCGVTKSWTGLRDLHFHESEGGKVCHHEKFVMAFLPKSMQLLISWLQSPSAVMLEPKKIKSVTTSTLSPSIYLQ